MTLLGHIENGMIVLDEATTLPDGMKVRVELVPVATHQPVTDKLQTDYEHYQSIIGAIDDMPSDLAEQHDHYIHGTPKK